MYLIVQIINGVDCCCRCSNGKFGGCVLKQRRNFMCEEHLKRLEERIHILLGYIVGINNWEKISKIVAESENAKECKETLNKEFELDESQSQAIIDMRCRALFRSERIKLQQEYEELVEQHRLLSNEIGKLR